MEEQVIEVRQAVLNTQLYIYHDIYMMFTHMFKMCEDEEYTKADVTAGILSAINRTIEQIEEIYNELETLNEEKEEEKGDD